MNNKRQNNYGLYFSSLVALVITISIIVYPKVALDASVHGIKLWFDVVFPSLLPFLVMTEILMGLGVVHFIGILLEPIMKPVFKLPGLGGFAVAMGLASGYPVGAKITGQLRREKQITKIEAERLVSFANTAGPVFMSGAIAVGMYGLPQVGPLLITAHYLSTIIIGLIMRFHKEKQPNQSVTTRTPQPGSTLHRAFNALTEQRKSDGRHFGTLLHEAISGSMQSLLFIGGCIIIFSVMLSMLEASGIISAINTGLASLLNFTQISPEIITAITAGFMEIDIGAQAASLAAAPLTQQLIATSAIIAWSGLSVHAQVSAMLQGTDISMAPYIGARFIHAILAAVITTLLLRPTNTLFQSLASLPALTSSFVVQPTFLITLWTASKTVFLIMALLLALGFITQLTRRIVFLWIKAN